MCGLVGVAGKLTISEENAFKMMLLLDTLRGEDSTGMLHVTTSGETNILKKAWSGFDIRNHKNFFSFFSKSYVCLLGHNRAATRGKVNDFNAHPFEIGNTIGAHNGTMTSVFNLKDGNMFDVDSEAIFHHIEHEGAIDFAAKGNGAFALTWYNKESRTINFLRNDQRPLYYAMSEDNKTIFWASESWMIMVACTKNNIKIGECNQFDVGHHYSVTLEFVHSSAAKEIELLKSDKLEFYKPTWQQSNTRGKVFPHSTNTMTTNGGDNTTKVTTIGKVAKVGDIVEIVVRGHYHGTNQAHIIGEIINRTGSISKVRIFADYKSSLWNYLLSSPNTFEVKLKKVGHEFSKGYFVADLRSINELVEDLDEGDEQVLVVGPDNKYITVTEWEKLTSDGCCYCAEGIIDPGQADKIIWLPQNYFICPDEKCQEQHQKSSSMLV